MHTREQEILRPIVALLRRLSYTMCFLVAMGISYTHADDNAAANKIFVDTVKLLQRAAAVKPTEAIGLYEQALQNLDRIVVTYPSSTLAVQLVSSQSIGHVSRPGVEQALRKAHQAVRQIECSQHLRAFCLLDEALETARGIGDSGSRAFILADIAAAQAKAGNMSAALEIARSIENSWHRPRALASIAAAQAKAGNMSAALEIAGSIEESLERTNAFHAIAVAQAKAGNVSAALETTRSVERGWRDSTLRDIAVTRAKAGNMTAALKTARSIEDSFQRALALCNIAETMVELGLK